MEGKFMKFIHQAQSKLAIVYIRDACKGYLLCSTSITRLLATQPYDLKADKPSIYS